MNQRLISTAVAIVAGLILSALVSKILDPNGTGADWTGFIVYVMFTPAVVVISTLVAAIGAGTEAGRYASLTALAAISFFLGGVFF